jgi:hypothetical protein
MRVLTHHDNNRSLQFFTLLNDTLLPHARLAALRPD